MTGSVWFALVGFGMSVRCGSHRPSYSCLNHISYYCGISLGDGEPDEDFPPLDRNKILRTYGRLTELCLREAGGTVRGVASASDIASSTNTSSTSKGQASTPAYRCSSPNLTQVASNAPSDKIHVGYLPAVSTYSNYV